MRWPRVRGLTFYISAVPIFGFPDSFTNLGSGRILGVPILVLIAAGVFVIGYLFLNRTPWGQHVYAFGVNSEAAPFGWDLHPGAAVHAVCGHGRGRGPGRLAARRPAEQRDAGHARPRLRDRCPHRDSSRRGSRSAAAAAGSAGVLVGGRVPRRLVERPGSARCQVVHSDTVEGHRTGGSRGAGHAGGKARDACCAGRRVRLLRSASRVARPSTPQLRRPLLRAAALNALMQHQLLRVRDGRGPFPLLRSGSIRVALR